MKRKASKVAAMILVTVILIYVFPVSSYAASVDENAATPDSAFPDRAVASAPGGSSADAPLGSAVENGLCVIDGKTYYYVNGAPFAAGLIKDGNDFYYINSSGEAVSGNYEVTRTNGLLLPGFYQFDKDGRMIDPPVYPDGPNKDGNFYRNGVRLIAYQLVEFEGKYYFISDYNKYARNITLFLNNDFVKGTDLEPGNYYFDSDGVLSVKNGPNADGYFYLDRVRLNAFQLVEFEGNYYFINDGHKYAKNTRLYLTNRFVGNTGLPVGYYDFDNTGKMILKNGPDTDGCFYLRNIKQKAYQLVEYNGDYYFIDSGNKYAAGRTVYMSARFVDAYGLPVGYYDFDETGKMILKNGPDADGCFYLRNVKQKAYQLVEYNGDYYFIDSGNKYAVSRTIYLSAKFVDPYGLSVGYYEFDATGKLLFKNGPDTDGFFYRNGVRQYAYQLAEYNGDYYFIDSGNKYAVSRTIYMSARFVDPYGLAVGYYSFDETGKMIVNNGPNQDGFFYLNGKKVTGYQIVSYKGDYYFINDGNKYAKNTRLFLGSRFTDSAGLRSGYYNFDANGKIIDPVVVINGPASDGCFYLNGVRQTAYKLIKYDGDYYFINDGNKFAKEKCIYCSNKFVDGTDLRVWDYWFDADGKMVGYIEGVPNGRDIGDVYFMKTSDGRDIKSGLLMRGGELDNANYYYPEKLLTNGINTVKNDFNVKLDMDLRAPAATGMELFGSDVVHKNYDMVLYDQVLTAKGKARIKEIFDDLADPDNYPIYMHCTHGIDRTGIVCFILETALGVSYGDSFNEYLMSVGAHDGSIIKVWNDVNNNYSGADSREKAVAFLKDCGITQEQIDSLYDIYLD